MEIRFESGEQTTVLGIDDLEAGAVYTNVSDAEDDDLYLFTDLGFLVALDTGTCFNKDDPWVIVARFKEVDVSLLVSK